MTSTNKLSITGYETRKVDVEINMRDLVPLLESGRIPFKTLYWSLKHSFAQQAVNVPEAFINKDGMWVKSVEYHTSHSFYTAEEIRIATDAEQELNDGLEELRILCFKHKLLGTGPQ